MGESEPHFEEESQIYKSGESPDAKEPSLEKETPLEGQEPQNEKEVGWKEAEQNLEKFGGIEDGIKETVVGLNVFGIETVNSCEGHFNHGRIAPWVSIEKWESKPQERYIGQKEFEQQVYERLGVVEINQRNWDYIKEHDEMAASFLLPGQVEFDKLSEDTRRQIAERDEGLIKKYDITPEVTKQWMDAGIQAEKEIEQVGKDGRLHKTEEYKQWKAENDAMKDRVQQLLGEFYEGRKTTKNAKIIIDQDGSGSWCIHNGGKDYYDVTRKPEDISDKEKNHYQKVLDGKNPKKEQKDFEKYVEKYRAEFQEFTEFLKRKHFGEQENSPDKKEVIWQKKEREIEQIPNIEKGAVKIIAALNLSEIPTSQSCEGHMYENETGINLPFIEISSPNQPEKRFLGQEKIIPKLAEKYGIKPEDVRTMLLHSMPHEEFHNSKETQNYKEWRKENNKIAKRAEKLLKDFYQDSATPEHVRLTVKEQNAGQFEISNVGREQDRPSVGEEKNLTTEQKTELNEQLTQYQREMDNFAGFLKQK